MYTRMVTKLFTVIFSLISILVVPTNSQAAKALSPEQQQARFITTLAKKYHINKNDLTSLFSHVHYDLGVIKRMNHPFEKKPWSYYRKFFVTPERIEGGVKFWEAHKKILDYANRQYGIPPSVIVAITGIETLYGKHAGRFNTFNTLATLAFNYPARAKFFSHQLAEFILLTREQKLSTLDIKGSYAGALGIPQFMPDVYRQYAVGYENPKSADIMNSNADAIVSIANYLKQRGKWRTHQPIASPAHHKGHIAATLLSDRAIPKHSLIWFRNRGITPKHKTRSQTRAAVIALDNLKKEKAEYWLVFNNFRAIMRYNPRINYAMAVYQLSRAIKISYEKQQVSRSAAKTPPRKLHRRA